MKTRPFQVSDKVVCVVAPRPKSSFRPALVLGRVYVVCEVCDCNDGTPGLRLVGVKGRKIDGVEIKHDPLRFRLLSDVKPEMPKAEAGQQHPEKETRTIPILDVPMMSDNRWIELCKMQAEAVRLVREGKDGEAFAVLCDTLHHDCPIRWLLECRELAVQPTVAKRKGGA